MKVFLEEQKMTKPLVIIVLSIAFIGISFSVFNDWENIAQNNLESKIIALSSLIILILISILFLSFKLKTRIDEKGIYFQFFPFHFSYRLITWNEISTCEVRNYNAILEYGGWGLKNGFRKKKGIAYNVKGNIGLQLELKNGKKILIGTQKKEEIQRVIKNYESKMTY